MVSDDLHAQFHTSQNQELTLQSSRFGHDGERLPRYYGILSSWDIYPMFVLILPSEGTRRRTNSFSSELSPEVSRLHPPPATSCSKKMNFPLGGQRKDFHKLAFPDLPTSRIICLSVLSPLISPSRIHSLNTHAHHTRTHTTRAHTHTPPRGEGCCSLFVLISVRPLVPVQPLKCSEGKIEVSDPLFLS